MEYNERSERGRMKIKRVQQSKSSLHDLVGCCCCWFDVVAFTKRKGIRHSFLWASNCFRGLFGFLDSQRYHNHTQPVSVQKGTQAKWRYAMINKVFYILKLFFSLLLLLLLLYSLCKLFRSCNRPVVMEMFVVAY